MRNVIFCCFVFGIIPIGVFSQIRVSGFVKDAQSNEVLAGAYVQVDGNQSITVTNSYGFFSFSDVRANDSLRISFIGFESRKIDVKSLELVNSIGLQPNSTIEEVVVRSKAENIKHEKLQPKTLSSLPVVMGETDITRTIQLLPGVVSGTESSAGFFVRGGNSDQNLLLIDGTPIYNSYHMMGLFSVFNSDAINDAKFYGGNIPAQYGGRLSSVMDISLREGNSKRFSG